MKRKIIALAIIMALSLVAIPKIASANPSYVYYYITTETFTDVHNCVVTVKRTYGVDIWTQTTLVNFEYERKCD